MLFQYATLFLIVIIWSPILISSQTTFKRDQAYPQPKNECTRRCNTWVYNCQKNESFHSFSKKYLPPVSEPQQSCWVGKFGNKTDAQKVDEHQQLIDEGKIDCDGCYINKPTLYRNQTKI